MKWLERDYVTGDWYVCGWSLNPWVLLDVVLVLLSATRWFWFIAAIFGAGLWIGAKIW